MSSLRAAGVVLGPAIPILPCSHPMDPACSAIASKKSQVSLAALSGLPNAPAPTGLLTGRLAGHGTIVLRASSQTGRPQLFVPMECHPASPPQLRPPLRLKLTTQVPVGRRLELSGAMAKGYPVC